MKSIVKLTAIVALVAIALIAGYWLGRTGTTPLAGPSCRGLIARKAKFFITATRWGIPISLAVPKKDSMGMDYLPVYEGEEPSASNSAVKISPKKYKSWG